MKIKIKMAQAFYGSSDMKPKVFNCFKAGNGWRLEIAEQILHSLDERREDNSLQQIIWKEELTQSKYTRKMPFTHPTQTTKP